MRGEERGLVGEGVDDLGHAGGYSLVHAVGTSTLLGRGMSRHQDTSRTVDRARRECHAGDVTELLVVGVVALVAIGRPAVLVLGSGSPHRSSWSRSASSRASYRGSPTAIDPRVDPRRRPAAAALLVRGLDAVRWPSAVSSARSAAVGPARHRVERGPGAVLRLGAAGLGFWWGIALGAIVSPTEAVATSIVKQTSRCPAGRSRSSTGSRCSTTRRRSCSCARRSPRAAASFSFWGALGDFARAVAIAVVIGWLVGWANVHLRSKVPNAAVNTALSFAVPFVASVPAELLHGPRARRSRRRRGFFTGIVGPRLLPPGHRLSDAQNWRTIELVLEGCRLPDDGPRALRHPPHRPGRARRGRSGAPRRGRRVVLTVLVRAAYVVPLLAALAAGARRGQRLQDRFAEMDTSDRSVLSDTIREHRPGNRAPTERDLDRFTVRVRRTLADIAYYTAAPLGWREGTAVVWAGMRGRRDGRRCADAARDDPATAALLVLVAFAVRRALARGARAARSARCCVASPNPHPTPTPDSDSDAGDTDQRRRLLELMRTAAERCRTVPKETQRTREELRAADPPSSGRWFGREKPGGWRSWTRSAAPGLDARDDGCLRRRGARVRVAGPRTPSRSPRTAWLPARLTTRAECRRGGALERGSYSPIATRKHAPPRRPGAGEPEGRMRSGRKGRSNPDRAEAARSGGGPRTSASRSTFGTSRVAPDTVTTIRTACGASSGSISLCGLVSAVERRVVTRSAIAMTASSASQVSPGSGGCRTPTTASDRHHPARTDPARSTGSSSWVPASTTWAVRRGRRVRARRAVCGPSRGPSLGVSTLPIPCSRDGWPERGQDLASRSVTRRITEGPVQSDRLVQNGGRP